MLSAWRLARSRARMRLLLEKALGDERERLSPSGGRSHERSEEGLWEHRAAGESPSCGPTAHRAVRKVILPPPHRSRERRREPTRAARELSVQSASSCNSRSHEARPLWVVLTVRFAERAGKSRLSWHAR